MTEPKRETWNKHASKWHEPGEEVPFTEMTKCEYCWRPVAVQGLKNHWRQNLKCRQYQREAGVDMSVTKQEFLLAEKSEWEECDVCGKKFHHWYDLEQHKQHSHGRSSGSGGVRLRSRSVDRSSVASRSTHKSQSSARDPRLCRPAPDRVLEAARERRRADKRQEKGEDRDIRPEDSMSQAGASAASVRQGKSIRGLADLFQAAANIIKNNIEDEP